MTDTDNTPRLDWQPEGRSRPGFVARTKVGSLTYELTVYKSPPLDTWGALVGTIELGDDLASDFDRGHGFPSEREAQVWAESTVVPFDEQAVWDAWNALPEDHPSPVKTIARDLGLSHRDVANVVFPLPQFFWDERTQPEVSA